MPLIAYFQVSQCIPKCDNFFSHIRRRSSTCRLQYGVLIRCSVLPYTCSTFPWICVRCKNGLIIILIHLSIKQISIFQSNLWLKQLNLSCSGGRWFHPDCNQHWNAKWVFLCDPEKKNNSYIQRTRCVSRGA